MAMLQMEEDPSKKQRLYETTQQFHDLIGRMEEVIVGYSASLMSLTDQDVQEAVLSLKSTYETERKGVIYERTSSNPLVQALVKELRGFLEEYRVKATEQSASLRVSDVVACLEFLTADIDHHLSHQSAKDDYLQFVARSHPEEARKPDQGGIILAP